MSTRGRNAVLRVTAGADARYELRLFIHVVMIILVDSEKGLSITETFWAEATED
jgi:hypothetical protein